jgi:hypothetical protein
LIRCPGVSCIILTTVVRSMKPWRSLSAGFMIQKKKAGGASDTAHGAVDTRATHTLAAWD